jgi:alkylation response protein AidB-like acyl-CoA dehydrogenase
VALDLPPSVWDYLKQKGFFGIIIAKEYGGLGFSALAHSTIVQKISTHSLTAAVSTMVPNSLGPAELLIHYGTEEQKQYYLPRLAKGQEIPCFALTSLEAGSDAGAIIDTGIVCKGLWRDEEIIGMKLTWDKRYITLAPVATVLGLAFKLYDPEGLLGTKEELGITLCLIPVSHPGVEVGQRHFPLNQPFMNGPTRGTEVFVPLEWIIGGPNMIGKGWHMLVECLSAGRGISLPALSTACAKLSYRTTGAYAAIRQQFHTPVGQFEGVQEAMAKIAGYTYVIEATRLFTLSALDEGIRPSIVTAIAKYHITEMARVVVNKAMDVHGGRAIMLGPNNYLGRCYESIPISITVEGANILTRNLMIFGQGAIRCHPYLQTEIKAMRHADTAAGINLFDQVFFKHIQYTVSNVARALLHSLTGGASYKAPSGVSKLKYYYRQLGRMAAVLSVVSDFSLILLGGKLKRRERLSARLGDVLSHLYLASSVLKYYQDFGTEEDLTYVEWSLQVCLYNIQTAFLAFFRNFPLRFLGYCFRIFVFPYGCPYAYPKDPLEKQLTNFMLSPSTFRDRLTQHCYLSKDHSNPVAHLEFTLNRMIETKDILLKLEVALKKGIIPKRLDRMTQIKNALSASVLKKEEADLLQIAEVARKKALRVDEFSEAQLIGK